jgi:hypothetical protein
MVRIWRTITGRETVKVLFVPRIIILRALENVGLRFFITRWGSHELSAELKAKRVKICREMPDVLKELGPQQMNHIITGDEC